MSETKNNQSSDLDRKLADWAQAEPAFDEAQLKKNLLGRMEDRPRRRARLVLAVAAVAVLAVFIGLESIRVRPAGYGDNSEVVYEPADNVILVLREGKSPIYVVTEAGRPGEGGER